jgi:hypothetical protein
MCTEVLAYTVVVRKADFASNFEVALGDAQT